jgi:hypothetical protein
MKVFFLNLDFVTIPLHTHILNAHNIIKKQLESEPVHNLNVPIILTEPLSALFYSYHVLYHLCAHALLLRSYFDHPAWLCYLTRI